jgi:hypothetical protein
METCSLFCKLGYYFNVNKIFRGEPPSFLAWKINFATSVKLQLYRLKLDDEALFWLGWSL